ncbi:SGNH/GDSL hydrolase family protein [Pseudorhodoferax sp. Leaf267]|uniref:SGNH/GDSL hydrolase family protein n=1 Tax=Pseudorhodoferax sp. Leaf267 TaxID=1736316 RepID=UPI0006FFB4D9|nr:SGNH/GDSL hydrolase family protein [Pseudorhodoferax sp. Leaf267]KQP21541.1 hypothetical protein ASF43_26650 [Pseudorhodoferax sp. Leaf267]
MNISFRTLWRALCLVACLAALPAAWAGQIKYPSLVVFGDSLSDTGNDFKLTTDLGLPTALPPSTSPHATYWQGRFTNGPVAVEYLWRLMSGKHNAAVVPSLADRAVRTQAAVSFAYGGSSSGTGQGVPLGFPVENLQSQVEQFKSALPGGKASKQALYVVWSGANDYLQGLSVDPDAVTNNVLKAITDLYDVGARDFLVPNLANLGGTPFVLGQGGPAAGAAATQLTKGHNALLKAKLAALRSQRRDIRIVEVDVFKLGETVVATGLVWASVPAVDYLEPVAEGQIPTSMCLFVPPTSTTHLCPDVRQSGIMPPFMFWDAMHPTTQVHGVLGTAMFGALLLQR